MKKLIATMIMGLAFALNAAAYVSTQGVDPNLGSYDVEYKSAVKSSTADYSDAISKGHGLYYDEGDLEGAYLVSRYYSGTANGATAAKITACIAGKDVATGNTNPFPCITKGYVDYGIYDATSPIPLYGYLCVGTAATVKGKLIGCDANVVSPFMALEAKASGSGTNLKVLIQAR